MHEPASRLSVKDHLLDGGAALEKAGPSIAGLGKAERLAFDEWLGAIMGALQDELLQPIYTSTPTWSPLPPIGRSHRQS